MLQWLKNNTQVVFLIIVLGMSAVHWVITKLREQAAIKRAQMERARREEEMLRTGRTPADTSVTPTSSRQRMPASAAEARERLAEIARRRQSQIEQARRESQRRLAPNQAAPTGQPGQSGPPPIIIMGPSGPISVPRPVQRPAPAQTAPKPPPIPLTRQPRILRPPTPPAAPRQKQRSAPAQAKRPEPTGAAAVGAIVSSVVAQKERPETSAAPAARSGQGAIRLPTASPKNAAEYRRMLAMVEVLSPPLAIRE